jgi:hypothetical protein
MFLYLELIHRLSSTLKLPDILCCRTSGKGGSLESRAFVVQVVGIWISGNGRSLVLSNPLGIQVSSRSGEQSWSIRVTVQEARVGRPIMTHNTFAADKELQPPTLLPRSLNRQISLGPITSCLKLQQGISRNSPEGR